MQNYEQIRYITDWERKNFKLGHQYKNALAKKPIEVVKNELEKLTKEYADVTFKVEPRGAMKIDSDRVIRFKKG